MSQASGLAPEISATTPANTAAGVAEPAMSTAPHILALNTPTPSLALLGSSIGNRKPEISQEPIQSGTGQLGHATPALQVQEGPTPTAAGTQLADRRSTRTRAKRVLELDSCIRGEIAGPRDVQRRPSSAQGRVARPFGYVYTIELFTQGRQYHLRETCIDLEIAPNGWVCPACLTNEAYGAANEGGKGAKSKRRHR